jgi:hypothetical protein
MAEKLIWNKVPFDKLKACQQENYNYHKLASVLAEYGYTSIRLTDDWEGADLIAQHINGGVFLKIQLKGRLFFGQRYLGKGLYIAFRDGDNWFLYPHDEVLKKVWEISSFEQTKAWRETKEYHFSSISEKIRTILKSYALKP